MSGGAPWSARGVSKDKLTLYVFGPGFGESQVVWLPDGKWMVVDSCVQGGVNLPLELLRHFEVTSIDLLATTHPDLDHYKGLRQLVEGFRVERLWQYPGFMTPREIIVQYKREDPDNKSWQELLEMRDAMDLAINKARVREAVYDTRWLPEAGPCRVTSVAPCDREKTYELERTGKLYARLQKGDKLTHNEERSRMGKANCLSLAIMIGWNDVGILLGGDVEHDDKRPDRGWLGLLEELNADEQLALIQGLRVVKLPHHGSESAFCEEAWKQHASTRPVELAVSTRFNKGVNPPPRTVALDKLLPYAQQLALPSSPEGDFSPVTHAGWVRVDHPSGPGDAACIAITLAPGAPLALSASTQAGLFRSVLAS